MTSPAAAPAPDRPAQADGVAWHVLTAERVLQQEEVDGQRGLSSGEAAARAERFGPNKFAEGKTEPRWHAFIQQWLVCIAVALSIIVVSEIRKIILRRRAAAAPAADAGGPEPLEGASRRESPGTDQGTWAVPPQRHSPPARSEP